MVPNKNDNRFDLQKWDNVYFCIEHVGQLSLYQDILRRHT